ncbi:MAG: hypothetical protein ACXQTS_02865 [Candidatus Methanospirareceae archaeon]
MIKNAFWYGSCWMVPRSLPRLVGLGTRKRMGMEMVVLVVPMATSVVVDGHIWADNSVDILSGVLRLSLLVVDDV